MDFDPRKRENLTGSMKTEIASFMQAMLLDGLMRNGSWTTKDLVFHGGTSIHLVWNSPRYSEDLDFMVSAEQASQIAEAVQGSVLAIETAFRDPDAPARIAAMADSVVTLKSAKRAMEAEGRSMLDFDVRWSHPSKQGVVRIKMEFYSVPPEVLSPYGSGQGVQGHGIPDLNLSPAVRAEIRPDQKLFMPDDVQAREKVPVATPTSIYGDKVLALAMRPYLKYRDFFDLWWLRTQMGVSLVDEDLLAAVRTSAGVYGYADAEVASKAEMLLTSSPTEVDNITENLRTFLPDSVHRALASQDAFRDMFQGAMGEMERVRCLLVPASPGVRAA